MVRSQTKIDLLMHQNGIKTDRELAEKLGISQQMLSYRLAGNLTIETLEMIADYFKLKVKDILL